MNDFDVTINSNQVFSSIELKKANYRKKLELSLKEKNICQKINNLH